MNHSLSPDPFEPVREKTEVREVNFVYYAAQHDGLNLSKEKVDHPEHYNQGKYEVVDVIQDWGLDFSEGNVVKYIARSKHKASRLEDLKKARWYLDYLISNLEKEKK